MWEGRSHWGRPGSALEMKMLPNTKGGQLMEEGEDELKKMHTGSLCKRINFHKNKYESFFQLQCFQQGQMVNKTQELHFSQTWCRTQLPFSVDSPTMILPPLLLVFSTDSAVLSPCSCLPSPWPSLKPYFCMILWATVPLQREKNHQLVKVSSRKLH